MKFRTFLRSRCYMEKGTMQWSISQMNTKRNVCANSWEGSLLKRRRERERGKRERGKMREFETQDLSTRILSRQLLSVRGVNVIGWIIANHPVCVQAATRDILAYPLVLRALWQIDSANLLSPNPLTLFCISGANFRPGFNSLRHDSTIN